MDQPAAPKPRILLCLSTAPQAIALAGEAVALAHLYEADLYLVHAGADTPETREKLTELLKLAGWPEEVPMIVRSGKPDQIACAAAEEFDADLVIAGAMERDRFTTEIFGSTARKVARKITRPLLLFTKPRTEGTPYHRIAISTHIDQPTADAINYILQLAKRAETKEIHILHEKDFYDRIAGSYASSQEQKRITTRPSLDIQSFLDAFDFGQVELKMAVLEEGEGLAAVQYGKRHRADLLVYPAPSRSLTFWDRFFNHPLELVLGNLPNALLIHRNKPTTEGDNH